MSKLISMCGITCSDCPAYIATREDDNQKRIETATEWSKMFNGNIKPEDINCEGCTTTGKKFTYCMECEMRKCGIAKNIKNCSSCEDYACKKLIEFFNMVPDAKIALDSLRK